MLTERIWSGNSLRNFFYLIADPDSGEALAVDPLDWRLCPGCRQEARLDDQADPQYPRALRPHRGQRRAQGCDAAPRCWRTRARRAASAPALTGDCKRATSSRSDAGQARVPGYPGAHHDPRVRCCRTPRTPALLLRRHALQRRRRQLPQRRHPEVLYDTFAAQLSRLPDGRAYPGHEYMGRNLEFTLDREPSNKEAVAALTAARG